MPVESKDRYRPQEDDFYFSDLKKPEPWMPSVDKKNSPSNTFNMKNLDHNKLN